MLADPKLPTTFWAEAVNTACYVHNRVLVVKPHNKTPYELFRGRTLALSFIRPFGCHVTILNIIDYLAKFDGKSDEGFFVGYSLNSKAFRVYNIRTGKVEENLHIRFLEDKPIIAGTTLMILCTEKVWVKDHSSRSQDLSQDYILMPMWKDGSIFDSLLKNLLEEPKKVIQALKDPSWIEAMQEELLQFKLQQVWTLVDLPHGKRAIEGIDYEEVFALVSMIEAIRLFLAYALFKDFVVYQMDMKSAFLYGKIEEEVYVCQPLGFEDPEFPDRVYKVEKALYGLHQAPRAWYETLSTYLLDNGFYQILVNTLKFPLLRAVKRIFRYFKGQPKLGLWYPKDSPFDLEAYTDSDYDSASLDKKSTTGGEVNCVNMQADDAKWMLEMNVIALMINSRLVCWPISTELERIGAKATAWNKFSSTMASAIICLAINQRFNFSKYIFDNMVKNLDGGVKFLMYPRGKTLKPSGSIEPITDEAANEEHVPIHSNDPLLSGEDRLKLNELMEICTNLSKRVLDLENTKTTQAAIAKLKERVKKL
ncbi:retrovirus-related pol polyprotein from transposon TNT 1-94 [Tanacetum coccineum]